MLELIGFITLLYLALKFLPGMLMFMLKLTVTLLLIIFAISAFEVIYHYIYFQI